ncbi:MAG: NADH-ubiquinone oxidoreductase-F iron-sulfur binding region domain-containing protein [Thermodesulfobacteriota bacterium]|nr:NADH-ubiquinone oxidoreductase-F iron-sulfur binding region domain-containing protein [Thermodesulfobacteriota bacterium]
MERIKSLKELEALRKSVIGRRDPNKPRITVCSGTGCQAYASEKVTKAFESELKKHGLDDKVDIKKTGCHGFCERGPLVIIYPDEIFYQRISVEDVPEIISQTILNGKVVENLLFTDPITAEKILHERQVPFYNKQLRIIFGNNSKIDPTNIEDYIACDGYSALAKVFSAMTPVDVIETIKQSGLRGRGGGGFPTGRKWESCRNSHGKTKYVIINADEGDPGAYMDRSLLEGNPHGILEGLIIGAYAIGSHEGYVYVRAEYPLAVKNIVTAIRQAKEYGFLGKDILGSGFDFNVRVNRGGGAFVCGESTALMASLEGKTGEPKAKYVHTVEKGLWEKPTVLNNVETWANVPVIILKGADWYNSIGTDGSKGTKIFSLVGKINNTGLVEVPMGMTLREIIYDIGGGIPKGKKFKAVQTGGPSGGCIPENLLDLPVDFDELTKVGSMMGSGAMIVMDENTCMVDIAKYFLAFLEEESCGKCVMCREGIKRMREILVRITEGKGKLEDMKRLMSLSEAIKDGALCALGGTAPNPVLTTMQYFQDEYVAHIEHKRCPAGVCKELITYSIDDQKCKGCKLCIKDCPVEAITFVEKKKPVILDQKKCIKCGTCYEVCKLDAVIVR